MTVANFRARKGDLAPCNTSNNSSSSISTSSSLSDCSGSDSGTITSGRSRLVRSRRSE